jgi:hypothetical protein
MTFRKKSIRFMHKYVSRGFRETTKLGGRQIDGERVEPLLERKRLKKELIKKESEKE